MSNNNPSGIEAIVCADIARRQATGIRKYGQTVSENPATLKEWMQHSYEERLDDVIYTRRAIAALDELAEEICKACIPGGQSCDPQQVADAIREFFKESK